MSAQGWYRDPFGRHEDRWYSAGTPTSLVRDGGVEAADEPPPGEWPEPLVKAPGNVLEAPTDDAPVRAPETPPSPGYDRSVFVAAEYNLSFGRFITPWRRRRRQKDAQDG
jgi:hypothetical protein